MSSERRLSETAAHLIQPEGIKSSGFTPINRVANKVGIRFDLWQQGFLWLLFAKNDQGRYACGEGGGVLSSCRQVGKSFMVGTALFIQAMLQPGLKVIWTAHHTRTSDEAFGDMCALARNPTLARYVDHIRRANGQQEVSFTDGSRIMFGARENGFGRGLHGVDVIVFDEAQILTTRALDNMIPSVNTSPNPLTIFLGNPPKPGDPSEAFAEKRATALAGAAKGMLYVEYSADRDADPDDHDQWTKANPSYPKRTPESAILRMRNLLAPDSFRREALGIWDETAVAHAIDPDKWKQAETDPDQPADGILNFGLDMPPDRSTLTIGCAIRYPNGRTLIQMADIRDTRRSGTRWAVEWLKERWPRTASVVIDAQSPAMSLMPDLKNQHIKVTVTGMQDMGRACGRFRDMLADGTLIHLPDDMQPQLANAVRNATTRPLGTSGATAWNKMGADVDISPLVACTLALWGAHTTKRHPGRKQKVMI